MFRWLVELVYAFTLRKQMSITLRAALRFVRCDYLTQLEIDKIVPRRGSRGK